MSEDMLAGKFDRVLSIEMFEHMKNYGLLFATISRWIKPSGKLFVHVFAHKLLPYHFESQDDNHCMSRSFFTGGPLPTEHLFAHFTDDLKLVEQVGGTGQHNNHT